MRGHVVQSGEDCGMAPRSHDQQAMVSEEPTEPGSLACINTLRPPPLKVHFHNANTSGDGLPAATPHAQPPCLAPHDQRLLLDSKHTSTAPQVCWHLCTPACTPGVVVFDTLSFA
jgi:hypothetical protein